MSELIERYVHQVGRYLPEKERADIQKELRSQIQDQLEDRYGASPSQTEVAAVLQGLGYPVAMAASYSRQQYLVGPTLYPFLMMVLRVGMPIIPGVVVLLSIVSALLAGETGNWIGLLIGSLFSGAQAALIFAAIVVLIFALIERSGMEPELKKEEPFNPLALPPVDDAADVDRAESSFGVAIGAFMSLALLYFLLVGGLTLRFNLADPGDVLPVPTEWLVIVLATTILLVIFNLWALVRGRWTFATWLAQLVVELIGAVGLSFVLWLPFFTWLGETLPDLREPVFLDRQPLIFTAITVGLTLLSSSGKLLRLWKGQRISV
jgi:hypothetical protein